MIRLYSHPGKLLKDHLLNVYHLGMKKYKSKAINFLTEKEIQICTEIVLLTHDFGKANYFFQRKLELTCKGEIDNQEYNELTKKGKNKSNHSLLSAVFTYYIIDEILNDNIFSLIGMAVVYSHHRNIKNLNDMTNFSKEDWDLLEEQFKAINLEELQKILELIKLKVDIRTLKFKILKDKIDCYKFRKKLRKLDLKSASYYLLFNFIYSILISSDKAEAIFYNKGFDFDRLEKLVLSRKKIDSDIVNKFKKIKGWDIPKSLIDEQRNQIYDEVLANISKVNLNKDRILSINVPTGTGKTLCSLAAGLKLRERVGQNYRLIYTLPFTSIIDQNHEVFFDVLEKTGEIVDSSLLIKHHYLTSKSYYVNYDYEDEEYDVSQHLIESWNSEIVVTTFVQLLHSIFSNQNRSLLKFYNISNSIILLDEVQTIPHKYWQLIKVMLKEFANKLGCYIIFITATMPLIYSENDNEIKELASSKEQYFFFFDRVKLNLSEFREEKTLDDFKEFLTFELVEYENENFLIVLNTINTSIEIFNYINELIEEEEIEGEAIYLSTNIIPKNRKERIDNIGDGSQRQIIISTQMVEAGVDIDLDRVYRDFGPLDSINQTCGRCNRNFDNNKQGIITLVKLINENHNNKNYASYVYDDTLLRITDKILSSLPDIVEEKNFFGINQQYFEEVNSIKSNDLSINLINKIVELKYEKAFWRDENNKEVFQLIEQSFETVNLFIEINEDAKAFWEKYKEIKKIKINNFNDYNKRKAEFEKIKGDFLSYIITIPKELAKEHLEEDQLEKTFNIITCDQISDVYNIDTGFIRDKDKIDNFF